MQDHMVVLHGRGIRAHLEYALGVIDAAHFFRLGKGKVYISSITTDPVAGESIGVADAAPAAGSDDGDDGDDADPEPRRRRKSESPRSTSSTSSTSPAADPGRVSRATQPEILRRLPDVLIRTGKSKPAIYAGIRRGDFPAPVKIGVRAVAWRDSDLIAWQEGLSTGTGPAPCSTSTGAR